MSKNMLGKNAEQDAVDPRLSLHFRQMHRLLDRFAKAGLRANHRFFKSARKFRLHLTGKMTIFEICP